MSAPDALPIRAMPGGISPPAHKQQSLREGIRQVALPQRLVIALTQPDFSKPELLAAPGDHVLKGQLLARGKSATGVACHASTSGTLLAITDHAVPNASGLPESCALLAPDGLDTWLRMTPLPHWQTLQPAELIARIGAAGISGLGGAGYPAQAKIASSLQKVRTLIINACECEPYLTADEALLRAHAAELVTGISMLLHVTGAPQCLIGIEDSMPQAIAAVRAAIDDERIRLAIVPARYPSGGEKQLIHMLTGVEVPSGALPLACGVLCHNVATVRAMARAVLHGEALVARIITVTGAALRRPGNLDVLIGTPVAALLRACEVDETRLHRLFSGGPLMGTQLAHADMPVLKTTSCILATTAEELPVPPPEQACIRCGYCADVCPALLLPQQLYWYARSKDYPKLDTHKLFDCIECGACAWVCPSHIPLVQYYRAAKGEMRVAQAKQMMAVHSKPRFEFHQARKAEEKLVEEQRRAERAALARQKPAGGGVASDAQAAIAAAMARVKAKKEAAASQQAASKPESPDEGNAQPAPPTDKEPGA